MSDRRQRLKNHIRAAKEWLGQAEHSLDSEDDLKSELKLMLAKAELKRADETDDGFSARKITTAGAWLKRLAAPLVAAAAAFWLGVFPADDGEIKEATPIDTAPVASISSEVKSDKLSVPDNKSLVATEEVAGVDTAPQVDVKPEQSTPAPLAEDEPPVADGYVDYPYDTYAYSAPGSAEPDENMQQLMQSAYFSLRN